MASETRYVLRAMLRDHSDQGLGWGVGGGAGEGCAGSAGAGESSLTDSLDGTEVWGGVGVQNWG